MPDGFIEAGDSLARDGAYVLGVGMKELGKVDDSVLAELSLNRDEVEVGSLNAFRCLYMRLSLPRALTRLSLEVMLSLVSGQALTKNY